MWVGGCMMTDANKARTAVERPLAEGISAAVFAPVRAWMYGCVVRAPDVVGELLGPAVLELVIPPTNRLGGSVAERPGGSAGFDSRSGLSLERVPYRDIAFSTETETKGRIDRIVVYTPP